MNRVEFLKNIQYSGTTQEIEVSNHFSRIMALYNLVSPEVPNITADATNPEMRFQIVSAFPEQSYRIFKSLESGIIHVYGHEFKIQILQYDDREIILELV